jgi:hypothetical protein
MNLFVKLCTLWLYDFDSRFPQRRLAFHKFNTHLSLSWELHAHQLKESAKARKELQRYFSACTLRIGNGDPVTDYHSSVSE